MSSHPPASTPSPDAELVALIELLALSHQDWLAGRTLSVEGLAQRVRNHSPHFCQINRDPKG